jgi:hypothetical protein
LALCVTILCCLPWTVRNYVDFHKVVPIRSNLGLELWLGNNPAADSLIPDLASPYTNPTLRREYVKQGEAAFMQNKQTEALQYIWHNPGRFLRFTWYRFCEVWIGTTVSIGDTWEIAGARARIALAANILIVLLGMTGLLLLRRFRSGIFFPFAAFPLLFPCIYYVTHPSLRYRYPMDSVLVLMTAYSFSVLLTALRKDKAAASVSVTTAVSQPLKTAAPE